MQEGIGRSGYRLVASVFFGIGALGLATTFYAFNRVNGNAGLYDWLGFALTAIALVAIYVLGLVVLGNRTPSAGARGGNATTMQPIDGAAPRPMVMGNTLSTIPTASPQNNPNFEFDDAQPAMDVDPTTTGPRTVVDDGYPTRRAPPAPREIEPLPRQTPILPPNRNIGKDAKGWPERRGPSGITRRQMMEQLEADRTGNAPGLVLHVDDEGGVTGEGEMAPVKFAGGRVPVEFARAAKAPTVMAKPATAAEPKPGTTRGKCGGCGAMLLAPAQRPVNLKCPRCDKVTLLS